MTSPEAILLAAIPVLIILSPLLYAAWIAWLEKRPGGATDYHLRRIRELCEQLEQPPPGELSALSYDEAMKEAIRLEASLKAKKRLEELRNSS